ncbi:flavodoxin family protein [Georgenia satyanarayanai]|uniref:flavodoxin family protein n=1 Tax=Georgenia satyanarayanai TaxID=860221 RepID=UPI00126556B2|nr:flavodoxin [Georgenia satyanarayanai]
MSAVVVYESELGNTAAVARAVAEGIGSFLAVELLDVASAPLPHEVVADLLVVGGPTHALGMSRPSTRRDAAARGGRVVTSGIREWLAASGPLAVRATTFDTHVRHPDLPGHAGRNAARVLRRLGAELVAEPESFYVRDAEGPLLPGELDRARAWGRSLGSLVTRASMPEASLEEEP